MVGKKILVTSLSADQSKETSCLLKINCQSKVEEGRLSTCERSAQLCCWRKPGSRRYICELSAWHCVDFVKEILITLSLRIKVNRQEM